MKQKHEDGVRRRPFGRAKKTRDYRKAHAEECKWWSDDYCTDKTIYQRHKEKEELRQILTTEE